VEKFLQHSGVAAPLLQANIDTDVIIPSREMKAVSKHGLGAGLFAGWRYSTPGGRDNNPDFVLNQAAYRGTSILLAGDNFGCGSSREHAVWALSEYGIRAILAAGFGTIFYNNCISNGLLPVRLAAEQIESLAAIVRVDPQQHLLHIDLHHQKISCADLVLEFHLEDDRREMLLQGLDPIDQTLGQLSIIEAFESRDRQQRPWVYADQ
jgi:3-isopropylmalate/(R)-2-methylmalate dehydratase small subunit